MSIAEKARIEIEGYSSEVEAEVSSIDDKHYEISSITIRPKVMLKNEKDYARLKGLLDKALEYCVVSRSVKPEIRIEHP